MVQHRTIPSRQLLYSLPVGEVDPSESVKEYDIRLMFPEVICSSIVINWFPPIIRAFLSCFSLNDTLRCPKIRFALLCYQQLIQ